MALEYKDIRIRKAEFVAKTQFLSDRLVVSSFGCH